MASAALKSPGFLMGLFNLSAIGASTFYLRSHIVYNLEEQEARLDEIEGTLRGHIGLIEESLDRLEGKGGERGQKMKELYEARGRDEKKKK
ncbi:histone acetyltransferase subunit [Lecanosticta acicola]|uniref:Histone acetyltransferase subunit n=1 Tax=Lecanosticta acicola TaxID=111012 RepID=A0AAI8YT73_9PEZI|nr:histone acetyltransferase subunit [Lecanosticta acicola]